MRRLLTLGLMLAALATVLVAAPAKADQHHPDANGCSNPLRPPGQADRGANWDFHASCDQHDVCYVYHQKGEYEAGRKACDDQFYQSMATHCFTKRAWWWPRQDCLNVAWAYYRAVRWFGFNPFYENWKPARANVRVG